jgi:hypothetical protein
MKGEDMEIKKSPKVFISYSHVDDRFEKKKKNAGTLVTGTVKVL